MPANAFKTLFLLLTLFATCTQCLLNEKKVGHFIIRGTFGVRQVTYAIKMKYFTIKTNSFFSKQNE